MAVRKFILVAGQSNATEIAPAQGWEDENPYLAIRSPQNAASQTPNFSNGSYNDLITLPYTFDGGQQTDLYGDGSNYGASEDVLASQWQYANVIGNASQAIRYLTFYDPTASYFNGGVGVTPTYPGTGMIAATSTSSTLLTTVRWQENPSGVKITRQRTGQEHEITSTTQDTNTIEVDPPLVPPPETGELFTYEVEATGAGDSRTLIFRNQFGGVAFTGAGEDILISSAIGQEAGSLLGKYACYVSQIRTSAGVKEAARLTCRGRYVAVGDVVRFIDGAVGNLSDISTIATGTNYYVTRVLSEGETLSVAAGHWNDANNQIKTPGHKLAHQEPIKFSGTLPSEINPDTTYYVDNQIALAAINWDATNDEIDVTGHGLSDTDIIVFSAGSTLPTGVSADTPYYVDVLTADSFAIYTDVGLSSRVTWSTAGGNATITLPNIFRLKTGIVVGSPTSVSFGSGGGACTVTRLDSYANFYISAKVGDDELTADADSGRDDSVLLGLVPFYQELALVQPGRFRGSLTGLQARCVHASGTSTPNIGVARALADVEYDLGNTRAVVSCDQWENDPQDGDRFVIEVQDQVADFHKWAMWLPWCPFEGKAKYVGPGLLSTLNNPVDNPVLGVVAGLRSGIQVGSKVRFYTSGKLPGPLVEGRDYYIETVTGNTNFYLKESYNSTTRIEGDGVAGSGTHTLYIVDAEGKENPYPPGFNYPNHHTIPRDYQPFDGGAWLTKKPSIAFHTGLAYRLHEHYGEVMDVAVCAVGGTSVGHKEVWDVPSGVILGHAWFDQMQLKSWSPGEQNNCFARLEDVLDAAKIAFEADGDTGECVGIFWVQGESDAANERLANNYENGMRKLKASIRDAVKSRSLTSLDPDKIPFIHPKVKEGAQWTYAETVNGAIQTLADEDVYSRTFSVADIEVNPDDVAHYSGKGMNDLGDLCYGAWKNIQRLNSSDADVDICNLALTNIGDKAAITSINPSDGSHQADLCARYFPLARDLLLERHRWDFTIRQVSPVALSSSGRVDWEYAYRLPSDFAGVISVIPKDSTDDQIKAGSVVPQPYAIETSTDLERVLYCNVEEAVLRYQAKITDSTKFSQMFVHAVSWQLASMLAGALIKGDEGAAAVQNASRMAEFYAERAAAFDSRTTREKPVVDTNTNPWDR